MDFSHFGKEPSETGFEIDHLKFIAKKTVELPEDFNVHPRLQKMHIANRLKSIDNNKLDWATAEACALVSLNMQGFNTRII